MVTDADLRERVLAAGPPPDAPVAVAVRPPAHSAPADTLAGEALVGLLDAGGREMCVLERGRPVGLLTAEQIVRTEHNPFVMSREIARAPTPGALAAPAGAACRGCCRAGGGGPRAARRVARADRPERTRRRCA